MILLELTLPSLNVTPTMQCLQFSKRTRMTTALEVYFASIYSFLRDLWQSMLGNVTV